MTLFDCTADLVGQLNGNGQKGMLQIDALPVGNFWLRHCSYLTPTRRECLASRSLVVTGHAQRRIENHLRLMLQLRYDTRCYFTMRSKTDMSQLNLPHGTDN